LNVELLTLSEVLEVSGVEGDFTVGVKKSPRYVDMEKCIACGLCAEKCPRKVDDEYNAGLGKRKAAYIRYGQTVPLKYALDPAHCLYLTRGKCKACEKYCPTGAIRFDDREEILSFKVGSLILTPGYRPFDPSIYDTFGYGSIPDVVTGIEYERLLSAGGPHMGHLVKPSNGREPRKIAWIQCVGSREIHRSGNGYCSSVCCMFAIKQTLVTAEHMPDGVEQAIFYMDIRSCGKEFERYYEGAKARGIRFVRARPHSIEPGPSNIGVRLSYIDASGRSVVEDFDLAVLSVGMETSRDAEALAASAGIELDDHRFAVTRSFDPVASTRPGIYVAGAFRSPKAIPRAVTEASAAAADASRALTGAKGSLSRERTYPPERDIAGEAPRIGVFVCSCGINIASVVDVQELAAYAKTLPHVVLVENNLFTCSTDTQDLIAQRIKEHRLNRIVVAACTPRTHEPLFHDTLREAGLNPYLLEMANIRNQNSWVHQRDPGNATLKARDQVRMAVARVALSTPLDRLHVKVVRRALVIGGGISGMTAALGLAGQGHETVLLEQGDRLGGNGWAINETWRGRPIRPLLEDLIRKVETHPGITVHKGAMLQSVQGSVGNFLSEIRVNGSVRTLEYGAAVIATGARESTPTEYGYGESPRIMTGLEFERELRGREESLRAARSVAFIQCVGSREPHRPYCSRVCCTHSIQHALALKTMSPDMAVTIFTRDVRTYGEREELYRKARQAGVIFVRFGLDSKPRVSLEDGRIFVTAVDSILERPVKLSADYLVLASAIVAGDSQAVVDLFKCGQNEDGFLNEAHPKLRPVDMSVDGLFVAGLCNYPKPVDEAISQAKAAASRANVILSREAMSLDAVKSSVTERCDGCALCVDVCPYRAIGLVEVTGQGSPRKRIQVQTSLCKGCGLCEATCPKGGVDVLGFTLDQLRAQVDAVLMVERSM
jgi:heterodisulfide reductase subunit A